MIIKFTCAIPHPLKYNVRYVIDTFLLSLRAHVSSTLKLMDLNSLSEDYNPLSLCIYIYVMTYVNEYMSP